MMTRNEFRTMEHGLGRAQASGLGAIAGGAGFALSLVTACGGPAEGPMLEQRRFDIIEGLHANSPQLNHTGALVAIDPLTGVPFSFCSSTLIGPETVVTAKHCAVVFPLAESEGFELAWAAGPRADAPVELIAVVAIDSAPGDVGGFVGMGRDVAVVHLEHATSIPPAVPKALGLEQSGQSMVSIGYGVYGASGAVDEQRRVGRETVNATEGLVFEAMFETFENFVEWAFTGQVTDQDFLATLPPDDPFIEVLSVQFETQILYDQHEAVTGLATSDTQTCFGDSGGPLARATRSGWETYGVVSGGLASIRRVCDFGTVYSTFGPRSLAFLEEAQQWVDPCGDVTKAGECSGTVARHCETSFVANIRRLAEEDCAASGLECVSSETGVGCGSAPAPEPVEPPEPGAEEILLQTVQSAFRPELVQQLLWQTRASSD